MDNHAFDKFLDEATHAVNDLWPEGLTSEELDELNDLLTQFFASKRTEKGGK